MTSQALSQDKLDEVINRVVQIAHPEEIVMLGSSARAQMKIDSDIDLLVVKTGAHRRQLAQAIYRGLYGVGIAVDVIVVTPEDIQRYRDNPTLIIEPALREGKLVYAA